MGRPPGSKKTSYTLDPSAFRAMQPPFQVRVTREIAGQASERIPLDTETYQTHDEVLALEGVVGRKTAGGVYLVVVTDYAKATIQWKFMVPGASVQPPETRAQAAQAGAISDAAARAATEQVQASLGQQAQPQQPFPFTAPPPFPFAPSTPTMGQPMMPSGAAPPQIDPYTTVPPNWDPAVWAQQPQMVRKLFWDQINRQNVAAGYGPMMQPQQPFMQQTPFGQFAMPGQQQQNPYASQYGQPQPQYGQWPYTYMPPVIPPAPSGGDPARDAEVKALHAQNAQLREAQVLRQATEAGDRSALQMKEMMQTFQAQAAEDRRQMREQIERMAAKPSGGDDALKAELAAMRQQLEQQRQQGEAGRALDAIKQEMLSSREAHAREMQGLQARIDTAKQDGQGSMMQALMLESRQAAERHSQQMTQFWQSQIASQPKLVETLTMFKQLGTSQLDPHLSKLIDFGLNQIQQGGGPSTAAIIADAIGGVTQAGSDIAKTVIQAGADKEMATARAKAQADAQLRAAAERAQRSHAGHAAPTPPQQLNGTPNPPVIQVVDESTTGGQPNGQANGHTPPPVAETTTEESYFGALYPYILRLRTPIYNNLISPEKVGELIVQQYLLAGGDYKLDVPCLHDLEQPETFHRAVTNAFPEASGGFRARLVEVLQQAIPAAAKAYNEQMEKARKETGEPEGEEDEEPDGGGAAA